METISELLKDVKIFLNERTSSPFWMPFVLSWCAWNYKFFVVLSSKMTPDEKFKYISETLYNGSDRIDYGILYPLYSALTIIIVLPLFLAILVWLNGQYKNLYKWISLLVKKDTPIGTQEKIDIEYRLANIQILHQDEISNIASENEKLKTRLSEITKKLIDAEQELNFLTTDSKEVGEEEDVTEAVQPTKTNDISDEEFSTYTKSLSDLERSIIEELGKKASYTSILDLESSLKIVPTYIIDALYSLGEKYLTESMPQNSGNHLYTLSPKGRKLYVRIFPLPTLETIIKQHQLNELTRPEVIILEKVSAESSPVSGEILTNSSPLLRALNMPIDDVLINLVKKNLLQPAGQLNNQHLFKITKEGKDIASKITRAEQAISHE